jgi:hypothetical protein
MTSKTLVNTSTLVLVLTMLASAQSKAQSPPDSPTTTITLLSLPDAPGFSSSSATASEFSSSDDATSAAAPDTVVTPGVRPFLHIASRRDITIEPGQTAPPLSAHNKVVLGLRESFTLFSVIGWTASAEYSQLLNDSPNYGTDAGAYGERLGATSLRLISQNIIGHAVFDPVFHDDPRYYKMGSGHNIFARTFYAATRALITKSDDGRTHPNYSLISGNLAGAALTNAYYPRINRGFKQTAETFGNSLGGSAFGFVVTEFLDDALRIAHLQKLE